MSLPNEYTELDYIQSSGTQYINTGVCANPHFSIEVSFQLAAKKSTWDTIFGARNGSYSRYTARFKNTSSGTLGVQYSSTGTGKAAVVETSLKKNDFYGDFRTVKFEKNVVYVDGVSTHTFAAPSDNVSYPYPLYLFANNDAGTAGDFGYFMVKYCKIWNDTELVRDFVPTVRKADYVVGMYDRVTDTFYTNAGTGMFDAVSADDPFILYKRLEYIESDGSQYIDTGRLPFSNSRIVSDVELLTIENTLKIYGSWDHIYSGYVETAFSLTRSADGTWQVKYGNKTANSTQTFNTGRCTIDHNQGAATITTETDTYTISTDGVFGERSFNSRIYLFANNKMSELDTPSPFRLYSMQIYEGETLVRDFFPVQDMVGDTAGAVGLLDVVNGVFYPSDGTGAFIAGPVVGNDEPEEPERPALVIGMAKINGVSLPITGGMAKVNGVVLPITGGMVKKGGVVTPITM